MFLSTTPAELAALTQAVDRGDGAAVHQVAHRLRGAAANLGATSLSARCADLERLGEADRLGDAHTLLNVLRGEFDRAATALRCATQPVSG